MMCKLVLVLVLALVGLGCQRAPSNRPETIAARLALPEAEGGDEVAYVAAFATKAEADAHVEAVRKAGGRAEIAAVDGRLVRAHVEPKAARSLATPSTALLARNTPVRIAAAPQAGSVPQEARTEGAAEAFLTARKVVGVDRLVERFPTADGRGTKVAIFDTGIDFGVEGVSVNTPGAEPKLKGFYDLSGFGRVVAEVVPDAPLATSYDVAGTTLTLDPSLGVTAILAKGVLDEAALAKDYLAAEPIDLNGDGEVTTYPYLVGRDRDGRLAVLLDANRDGKLADAAREELTDYNTTYKHIDLFGSGPTSGAHPLAVTITSATVLQFHAVPGGHGTSCAIIIAGDGYANGTLRGMAPKAQVLAYVLDVTGQDVYAMDEFLAMFVHAKAQGVDAISISWGFATADLASARFVADFLDREIAAQGIVIGIAAGNGGPGAGSAVADDYIPRKGFGVGAYVSADQARNVYGWTGDALDGVIHYSSFGPTAGGRLVPDVVSPLMTLVRGERGHVGPRFYGFGGTSSATPALIGATTALVSALKQSGEAKIDTRLLKLAVQNTAAPLEATPGNRQGAGLLDVAAAYDVYKALAAEDAAAKADATRKTPHAYELRAETSPDGGTQKVEGLYLRRFVPEALVTVTLSAESRALVDPLTFVEPLAVRHAGTIVRTPSFVALQPHGAQFTVELVAEALKAPGAYSDVIELVRERDGLSLLRIPVTVEIAGTADGEGVVARVGQTFEPLTVWRQPVALAEPSALRFDGVAIDRGGNRNARVAIAVRNAAGSYVFWSADVLVSGVLNLAKVTPLLPAGAYELLVFRTAGQPAVLADVDVHGAFSLPSAKLVAAAADGNAVSLAVQATYDLASVRGAQLKLTGSRRTTTLARRDDATRKGFYGSVALANETTLVNVALRQKPFDAAVETMRHVEATFLEPATALPLYRGWVDVVTPGTPRAATELVKPVTAFDVVAYPNIVDWSAFKTRELLLDVETVLAQPVTAAQALQVNVLRGEVLRLELALPEGALLPSGAVGELVLTDAAGKQLAAVTVEL